MEEAYYVYGINGITTRKENDNIMVINFGNGKLPLYIFRKDLIDFIHAIIPVEELEYLGITDEKILSVVEEKGVESLDELIKGRGMVLITDFKNYFEYSNGGQNGVKKITSIDIDGKFGRESAFDYESRKPSYYDLYPPETRDSEFERAMEMLVEDIKKGVQDPKRSTDDDDSNPGGDNR